MNENDYVLLGLVMGFAVFSIFFVVDYVYYNIPALEDANNQCIERGFDQYKYFDRVPFTVKPVAIKCEYADSYVHTKEDG